LPENATSPVTRILRRAGWRTGDHLSVCNQLLLHIVMDVNDMVAFLPEVNVRYVDEDGRH
jgi:hypothetical protein